MTWNGSHWTVRTVPDGQGLAHLYDVKCRSARWCMAVGTSAQGSRAPSLLAERWNGSAWKMQPMPEPAGGSGGQGGLLQAIACPPADTRRAHLLALRYSSR